MNWGKSLLLVKTKFQEDKFGREFTDPGLPGVSGFEVAKAIKNRYCHAGDFNILKMLFKFFW